ncbi:hypothetical protein NVP1063O_033 [Vibrio phage 1.063.O._10N.261.45.C7]|nr:hypothetical protein NVP1063O_033 [Vibrio phage 1.063.O._10N.261.45.C7]
MITREEFENSYIINDHGELRDKYLKFATRNGKGFSTNFSRHFPIILVGSDSKIQHWTDLKRFFNSRWIDTNQLKQLTLADFEEEDQKEKEEMETPVIDWGQAPEGYNYWINYVGYLPEKPIPDFHRLCNRAGVEVYEDVDGEYYLKGDKYIVVHKRPEPFETSKKYNCTLLDVESVFDLKDMFEKGEIYFKAIGDREDGSFGVVYDKIVDEQMLICRYEEGRLLKREEVKWQDEVSQYVLKEGITYSCNGAKHIRGLADYSDEQFLEMCRIALRATGELK